MALDVAKAYGSVDRDCLYTVLAHLGITDNPFFKLLWRSLVFGKSAVCGAGHLSESWTTTRGIKQGCPASPIIFSLLLSGLSRYLQRTVSDCGISVGDQLKLVSLYADDIKLMCNSADSLNQCVLAIKSYLA